MNEHHIDWAHHAAPESGVGRRTAKNRLLSSGTFASESSGELFFFAKDEDVIMK